MGKQPFGEKPKKKVQEPPAIEPEVMEDEFDDDIDDHGGFDPMALPEKSDEIKLAETLEKLSDQISDKKEKKKLHEIQIPEKDEYWGIIVREAENENQCRNVPLNVAGESFNLQRGVEVILPSNVVKGLDDACSPTYARDGVKHFRTVGKFREFPFQITRKDYKRADFLKMLREGNRVQAAAQIKNRENQPEVEVLNEVGEHQPQAQG